LTVHGAHVYYISTIFEDVNNARKGALPPRPKGRGFRAQIR
jgi:hypothetical protein